MKNVSIFIGRFQPPSLAHSKIIDKMKNPVIFIVRGKGVSKEKNPFDFNTQVELLKLSNKKVENVFEVSSAFIGDIVSILREHEMEPVKLYCGSDRIDTYKDLIERYKDKLKINIKLKQIERDNISATKIREAIKNNDFNLFMKLTKGYNKETFNKLGEMLK